MKGFIRWAGAIGGLVAGLGVLAFCAGFLAVRAQYQAVRVPFVFVDYWSYAETGTSVLLTSITTILKRPWVLAVIALASTTIILLFEWQRFRRGVLKAHWNFVGYVVCMGILALVVYQELAVHALIGRPRLGAGTDAEADRPGAPCTVGELPVCCPYDQFVPEGAELPLAKEFRFPNFGDASSADVWKRMADELEAERKAFSPRYHLRPRPPWVLAPSKNAAGSTTKPATGGGASKAAALSASPDATAATSEAASARKGSAPADGSKLPSEVGILGVSRPEKTLPEARARRLYQLLVASVLFCIWLFVIMNAWHKRTLEHMKNTGAAQEEPPGRLATLAHRLREEIWFCCRWILRPLTAIELGAALLLLPDCFGLLAMGQLGKELVEVVTPEPEGSHQPREAGEAGSSTGASDSSVVGLRSAAGPASGQTSQLDPRKTLREALRIATEYAAHLDEPELCDANRAEWEARLAAIEGCEDQAVTGLLRRIAELSSPLAPELAELAYDAWVRQSHLRPSVRTGFVLYYPRSKTDYLRLIEPSPVPRRASWAIRQIPIQEIQEVRAQSLDAKSQRLESLLRSLTANRAGEKKNEIILKIQELGHPRTLEVQMAGVLDPSREVQGRAITAVGLYAAQMPCTGFGAVRRERAARLLLTAIDDTGVRSDLRGAAATALHMFVSARDGTLHGEVCEHLLRVLRKDGKTLNDEQWQLRGSVATTLGIMKYREAVDAIVDLVSTGKSGDEEVPSKVWGALPTALHLIGESEKSVPALAAILNAPSTPVEAVGTAVTALGILGCSPNRKKAVAALSKFLSGADAPSRRLEKAFQEDHRAAAVDALRMLGDRYAVTVLEELAKGALEGSVVVRGKAIVALGELNNVASQELLLKLAGDPGEPIPLRRVALGALREFADQRALVRLATLHDDSQTSSIMRSAIRDVFIARSGGSSRARQWLEDNPEGISQIRDLLKGALDQLIENESGGQTRDDDAVDTED